MICGQVLVKRYAIWFFDGRKALRPVNEYFISLIIAVTVLQEYFLRKNASHVKNLYESSGFRSRV